MAVTLNPEQERLVQEELRSGRYRSAEEVISEALAALRKRARGCTTGTAEARRLAVQDMLQFAQRNRTPLRDISVKELIHEGHRV